MWCRKAGSVEEWVGAKPLCQGSKLGMAEVRREVREPGPGRELPLTNPVTAPSSPPGPEASVSRAEQHQGGEGPPFASVSTLESLKHGTGVSDKALDVAFAEGGRGIVVRLVPPVLQFHETTGEVTDLDTEGTHVPAPAHLSGAPVVQSPVDTDPAGLSASVPVEELVRAALGKTVEQRVVDCADRTTEVGL